MPGPCSAPNGDARLVSAERTMCATHGEHWNRCDEKCSSRITLREYLARRNKMVSGKTRATKGR